MVPKIHIITPIDKVIYHNIFLLVNMNQLAIYYAYKLSVLVNDVGKRMKASISYSLIKLTNIAESTSTQRLEILLFTNGRPK